MHTAPCLELVGFIGYPAPAFVPYDILSRLFLSAYVPSRDCRIGKRLFGIGFRTKQTHRTSEFGAFGSILT